MKIKEASDVVCVFILLIFYFSAPHFPLLVLARFYTTLLLVSVFAFLFSYYIEKLLKEVDSLITLDPLTKALNRHTFHCAIEAAIDANRRYKAPATLFMFDLDNF